VLIVFGGSKDVSFNQEISDLLGQTRVRRTSWQHSRTGGRTTSGEDIAVLRPEEIRRLPERQALIVAENGRPILARLDRCTDGRTGADLTAAQGRLRNRLQAARPADTAAERSLAALAAAERHGLTENDGGGST